MKIDTILMIAAWMAWSLGGLWLTIRVITRQRDFYAFEIFPALILCAFVGPLCAATWLPSDNGPPRTLFQNRREGEH